MAYYEAFEETTPAVFTHTSIQARQNNTKDVTTSFQTSV